MYLGRRQGELRGKGKEKGKIYKGKRDTKMATNTLLIEGSFDELADELARYIDSIRKSVSAASATPSAEVPSVHAEIAPLLEKLREKEQSEEELTEAQTKEIQKERTEVLKKVVLAASVLNGAPEKGMSILLLCLSARKTDS